MSTTTASTSTAMDIDSNVGSEKKQDISSSAAVGGASDSAAEKDATVTVPALSLDFEDNYTFSIRSKEKLEFKVTKKQGLMSELIKTMIDAHGDDDIKTNGIDLPLVAGAQLAEIVAYMRKHDGKRPPLIEKPLKSKEMKGMVLHVGV